MSVPGDSPLPLANFRMWELGGSTYYSSQEHTIVRPMLEQHERQRKHVSHSTLLKPLRPHNKRVFPIPSRRWPRPKMTQHWPHLKTESPKQIIARPQHDPCLPSQNWSVWTLMLRLIWNLRNKRSFKRGSWLRKTMPLGKRPHAVGE